MSRIIIEAILICIYETILVASLPPKKQSLGRVLSSYGLRKVYALEVLTPKMFTDTCKPETASEQSDQAKELKLPGDPSWSKLLRPPVPQTSNRRVTSFIETNMYPMIEDSSEEKETEGENKDKEMANFAIELSYKIYVNKSIRQRKDLPDTKRNILLDLLNLDEAICKEVDLLYKTKYYSTLDIIQCTTFVSVDEKKSIYKAYNHKNFGLQQSRVVEHMLNSAKK
ncbi:MAG: hypothetical protein M1840_001196 [Geoglossum simile]|nr:MAG: hypothetical protein M1840_001196 [Geoglossum simile]